MRCSQPLTRLDACVLLVAIASVFCAFHGSRGILLRPSWAQAVDADARPPAPIVTDLNGDGLPEVILASPDGRLLLLSPASDRSEASPLPGASDSPWRALPVRRSASLRSQTGLATGRRPLALAAGPLVTLGGAPARAGGGSQAKRIVVALTEDWTVLAFDEQLRLLWEHSVGIRATRPRRAAAGDDDADEDQTWREEVALLISPQPIYTGDRGVVLVGGHTERHAPSAGRHAGEQAPAPAAPGHVSGHHGSAADGSAAGTQSAHAWGTPAMAPDSVSSSAHFSYHALESGGGALRWSHRQSDFHRPLHGDEHFTPQMDYRLDLDKVGGGEASIDGRHEGERSWRFFSESVLALLPRTWRHPHDTSLSLARFDRSRRPSTRAKRLRAAASGAAHAASSHSLELTSRLLGSAASRANGSAASGGASGASGSVGSGAGGDAPNVLVASRRHGVEVLHLYTGRPLTQLPLQPHAAHADINGDGSVDHVSGLSSHDTHTLLAEAAALHGTPRHKPARNAEAVVCLGTCASGVPAREELWNASICGAKGAMRGVHQRGRRGKGGGGAGHKHAQGVTTPLLLPRDAAASGGKRTMDSIFLASDGRVTSIGADGSLNWLAATEAGWRTLSPSGTPANEELLPSVSLYVPADGTEPLIAALGEASICILSAAGRLLACQKLPHAPIAPPVLADFSADGIADIIVPCSQAVLGLRVATGAGSLLQKLLFCFLALAVGLAVVLRYGGADLMG